MPAGQRKTAQSNSYADDGDTAAGGAERAESGISGLAEEAMHRIEDVTTSMADRGEEALADAGETLRGAGRATTELAGEMADRARTAGARAAHRIEAEFGERPWTVVLAAAAVAGVLGFLIGSRRHSRY
jgi:ElaB/YqjD/DUF883 family membrane-anchored ribosome-binding protein